MVIGQVQIKHLIIVSWFDKHTSDGSLVAHQVFVLSTTRKSVFLPHVRPVLRSGAVVPSDNKPNRTSHRTGFTKYTNLSCQYSNYSNTAALSVILL